MACCYKINHLLYNKHEYIAGHLTFMARVEHFKILHQKNLNINARYALYLLLLLNQRIDFQQENLSCLWLRKINQITSLEASSSLSCKTCRKLCIKEHKTFKLCLTTTFRCTVRYSMLIRSHTLTVYCTNTTALSP